VDSEVEPGNRSGRPNYSPEFKHRLAVAACKSGVSVTKLVQDHGINANMLFKWRRDLRAGLLTGPATSETRLLPVLLKSFSAPAKPASGAAHGVAIEINHCGVCRTCLRFVIQLASVPFQASKI